MSINHISLNTLSVIAGAVFIVLIANCACAPTTSAPSVRTSNPSSPPSSADVAAASPLRTSQRGRKSKSLGGYFDYLNPFLPSAHAPVAPPPLYPEPHALVDDDYDFDGIANVQFENRHDNRDSDEVNEGDDDNDDDYADTNELGRTLPKRKRNRNRNRNKIGASIAQNTAAGPMRTHAQAQAQAAAAFNSPIYYIRLPPQPYMFVPGLGYVSQPQQPSPHQFLNLPVSFVSNGKPANIYQWSSGGMVQEGFDELVQQQQQQHQHMQSIPTRPIRPVKPTPAKPLTDSPIHRLPGQYVFNGKPDDIYVLRDSYNSLYSDALQNFYP